MADSLLHRKVRKSNFSTDEVDVLVDSVRTHYNVLYGKFAKRATNRWIRQKAWNDILKKVNRVSIEKRTLQEVKNKWKKCQYAMKEKVACGDLIDDPADSSWDDMDSMPLQERLSKVQAQEKLAATAGGQVLKSQPLSPTKLKVTRHSPKAPVKPVERPKSPVNEEMCLRWNSHHSNMQTAFPNILSKEQYVDVTLAAEGKTLKCHRLVLSSCSPYFEEILSGISPFQHPVLFMRDIPFWILKSLCDFMYAGEVHIFQNKLEELLTVAEILKIKGLAGKSSTPANQEESNSNNNNTSNSKPEPSSNQQNNKEGKKKHNHQEKIQHSAPIKKLPIFNPSNNFGSTSHDYDDDLLDPLELLEPLYEEVAEEKKPSSTIVKPPKETKYQYQPIKKPFTRKLRKRKYSEQRETSPPPVFSFRKGTRSRPNVKIPKYYHTDFSNIAKQNSNSQSDPLLDVDEIKTEPIDVEDNLINYSDEENQYVENSISKNISPIIITSTKPAFPQQDKFKRIKLSKPIITEVHTIGESNTTAGGLEVIKITLQQPQSEEKKEDEPNLDQQENAKADKSATIQEDTNVAIVSTEGAISEETEGSNVPDVVTENGAEGPPELSKEETNELPTDEPSQQESTTQVSEDNSVEKEDVASKIVEDDIEPPDLPLMTAVGISEPTEEAQMTTDKVNENEEMEVETEEIIPETPEAIEETTPEASEDTIPEAIEETEPEETANNNRLEEVEEHNEINKDIQIEDIRTTSNEEETEEMQCDGEVMTTALEHLENEAMNVAEAINTEDRNVPPDIE